MNPATLKKYFKSFFDIFLKKNLKYESDSFKMNKLL
jgi:hypothetical protein